MRKGRGPSRSLFASLPFELKHNLRAQALEPIVNQTDSVRVKAEQILEATMDGLLSTQPPSDADSGSGSEGENEDDNELEEDKERQVGDEEESMNEPLVDPVVPVPPLERPMVTSNSSSAKTSKQIQHQSTTMEAGPSKLTPTPIVKSVRYESRAPVPASWGSCSDARASTSTINPSKRKKGKKPAENPVNPYADHPWDCTGLVPRYTDYTDVPSDLVKYFAQRRLYFPEYDHLPLLLDRTGWFSITPQPIAAHVAQRCACDLVVDAFCGVGGNVIEFAKTCERVIAIDNDITRLKIARHNALHLGVADRVEFILGDFTDFARAYSARSKGKDSHEEAIDVVFLSPPWGGINYLEGSETFPLSAILPIPGDELFQLTSTLTPNMAYYLPRNTDLTQISQLAKTLEGPLGAESADPHANTNGLHRKREWVEVEEEWVGEKLKAITAYYGGLVADE